MTSFRADARQIRRGVALVLREELHHMFVTVYGVCGVCRLMYVRASVRMCVHVYMFLRQFEYVRAVSVRVSVYCA